MSAHLGGVRRPPDRARFEPKRIAGFPSEVLVLGAYSAEHGVVLLQGDRDVEPGSAIG